MTTSAVLELAELLARSRCLLLDFDRPICSVFAGRASRTIVIDLLRIVSTYNVPVPAGLADTGDPLEVLRYAATIDTQLTQRVPRHLRAAEVDTHAPRRATRGHRQQQLLSGDLAAHAIDVDLVVVRTSPDPTLLKPSPHLVLEAMRAFGNDPDVCILVGDSVSDIVAARQAGIRSIGYANADHKRQALSNAGADVVIDDMETLNRAAAA